MGEIVGATLPVEVKKSCRKQKKDVCPKHIYLIAKEERKSFWGKASSRQFSLLNHRLKQYLNNCPQKSALRRVDWKGKIFFFSLFISLFWRTKRKRGTKLPRMNSDVWCDWGEKPELVFGYSSWMPANRKGRRITFPAAASSCLQRSCQLLAKSRRARELWKLLGDRHWMFPFLFFWFSFPSACGRISFINPEMPRFKRKKFFLKWRKIK